MADDDILEARWRVLAEKAVGGDFAKLTSRSAEGMTIMPLYPRREQHGSGPWRATAAWTVAQRVDHPDPASANRSALLDLGGGADALTLVFAESSFSRGFGMAGTVDLDAVLADIEIDLIGLRLDAGGATMTVARALADLIEARVLTSADLTIDFGYDPIGIAARGGVTPKGDALPRLLEGLAKAGLAGRALMADGRPYHEAGAGEAQELAAVLASGVAYLRRLKATGLDLDAARDTLSFLLCADADVLLGLAKFRALRRLWARVEDACGLTPRPIRLHAETAWRMMTRRDPWVNVMRATAATVAAGLGGADYVTVLPLSLPLGLPDDAARRLARNVQRVLIDEANLGMVDDPAAGAGGFEALTDALCDEAWRLLQAIEAEGGIETSLRAGSLKSRIAATARQRAADHAALRKGIVGTSHFPSLDLPEIAVLPLPPRPDARKDANALSSRRDAEPFEALRDRADACATRPTLFLATLGAPAAFGPRAAYAANFLAVAGIAAVPMAEERDISSLSADFQASGSAAACLCGADQAYAKDAVALAAALRDVGARRVLLAGRPQEPWQSADIDAFIHDGCDAIAILTEVLDATAAAQAEPRSA